MTFSIIYCWYLFSKTSVGCWVLFQAITVTIYKGRINCNPLQPIFKIDNMYNRPKIICTYQFAKLILNH